MTTIDTMTRATVRDLSDEALRALQLVAEKHGLTVRYEGGSFTTADCKLRFTFACQTGEGIPADFARLAPRYGLKAEDWGKTFQLQGMEMRLTAIKPSRRKFPITVERTRDGKGFKLTAHDVKAALAAA